MQGCHGSAMPGVQCQQKIKHFVSAALTDQDSVGSHSKSLADQIFQCNGTKAIRVGRSGQEAQEVRVLRLDFSGVLKRDEALSLGDEREQVIEQCRFA
jgi:hypothetical protein